MNNVVLIGRLTRDPELRHLDSGTSVTSFTLAVDKGLSKQKRQEMEANGKPTADFIPITVWGKQGESCAQYLTKGKLVGVQGRMQTSKHEKDGIMRYNTDVVANSVEFLEYLGDKKEESSPTENASKESFQPANDDIPF